MRLKKETQRNVTQGILASGQLSNTYYAPQMKKKKNGNEETLFDRIQKLKRLGFSPQKSNFTY